MRILLIAAVLPVIGLCYYVYKKDLNHEPMSLLLRIFALGFFSAIPVLFLELFLDSFFSTTEYDNLIDLFISVFVSVALIEEGFKWLITKIFGYNNKEFDEIYDIIVYAVFASLGFACIENILYVFSNGLGNAFLRALLSIPGHTCDGVIMGYFLSQAKVSQLSGNSKRYYKNILLSLFVPILVHTTYDTILFYGEGIYSVFIFLAFHISTLIVCFQIIMKISTIQQNLNTNIATGTLIRGEDGQLTYQAISSETNTVNYCPVCGSNVNNCNYCPTCGFKIK